jgi:hypothetical protein
MTVSQPSFFPRLLGSRRSVPVIFFETDPPLIFRFYLKKNPARPFWNQLGKPVGPFDYRNTIAEKVIVQPESFNSRPVLEAKKIEMVNRQSPAAVFVDDRERRAGDIRAAPQSGDDTFDENGFTAAQVSVQSEN